MKSSLRVLVLGCGGIGGTVAAWLTDGGADVVAVTRNSAVAQAVNSRGYELTGVGSQGVRRVQGRMHTTIPAGSYDLVILATQPPDLDAAVRQALPQLAPDGHLLTFPNGLPEERVARLLPDHGRVIGGIVAWGAVQTRPGVFERTSEGGFLLGTLDGSRPPVLSWLCDRLSPIGPVQVTSNLRGARWSKLALNCAISSLGTLGGDRLGVLLRARHVRRLALEVMTEVVAVARADGVKLEKLAGTVDLEWVALTDRERSARGSFSLAAKHALLMVVGLKYRRLRSSMLAALERGQEPPVDFLNGEVTGRGTVHGLSMPINTALVERIHGLAAGHGVPAHANLVRLYADTRNA
ncbi:MAG: ketopantoate reductase family protein [Oligoflexia bacterium]|nr:ketopantoate reductase family protein [Oligoflexia bacterium]